MAHRLDDTQSIVTDNGPKITSKAMFNRNWKSTRYIHTVLARIASASWTVTRLVGI